MSSRRKWRQFSLQGVLLIIAVTAVALAWFRAVTLPHWREQTVVQLVKDLGGSVQYDEGELTTILLYSATTLVQDEHLKTIRQAPTIRTLRLDGSDVTDEGLEAIGPLRQLQFFTIDNCQIGDQGAQTIGRRSSIRALCVRNCPIGDEGVRALAQLDLSLLSLDGTQVSDEGLRHVGELKHLSELHLENTRISDAGLKHLSGCESLETIILSNTAITDAGLEHLAGLKNLQHVSVEGAAVTRAGVMRLKQRRPNCTFWPPISQLPE